MSHSANTARWSTLDRIVSVEPGTGAVALRNVPNTLSIFDSHFPRFHVLPGVLILGSLGALGALLLEQETEQPWRLVGGRQGRLSPLRRARRSDAALGEAQGAHRRGRRRQRRGRGRRPRRHPCAAPALRADRSAMSRRVAITGIGLLTPLGVGVEPTWDALLGGKSAVGPIAGYRRLLAAHPTRRRDRRSEAQGIRGAPPPAHDDALRHGGRRRRRAGSARPRRGAPRGPRGAPCAVHREQQGDQRARALRGCRGRRARRARRCRHAPLRRSLRLGRAPPVLHRGPPGRLPLLHLRGLRAARRQHLLRRHSRVGHDRHRPRLSRDQARRGRHRFGRRGRRAGVLVEHGQDRLAVHHEHEQRARRAAPAAPSTASATGP